MSNYPPGFNGHFPWDDPYFCEVCGNDADNDCICPECPECGDYGNPECYQKHGLVLNKYQRITLEYREYLDILQGKEDDMFYQDHYLSGDE